jgi:hypothetical protein
MPAFPSFIGEMSDNPDIFASLIEVSMEARVSFMIKHSFFNPLNIYLYIVYYSRSFVFNIYLFSRNDFYK